MPKIIIPPVSTKQWSGIFEGDVFGSLFLSKNIDLERVKGKVVLGEALSAIATSENNTGNNDTDLTTPAQFVRTAADSTDRWWALGGKLFKTTNTDPEAGWTQDAIANTPSSPLYDMMEFVDDLYVVTATNVDRLVSGTWTNNFWSSLTGASSLQSVPHRLIEFAGALLITDGRFINDYDGTLARDPALTLPSNMEARWMQKMDDFVIIGGASLDGNDAEIFLWDRTADTFNARYGVGDREAIAGFVIAGIPYIITKKGAIKRFTGQGFRQIQAFPTYEAGVDISDINPNGIIVDGSKALINVNMGVSSNLRVMSGLWQYDSATNNLYHKHSGRNNSAKDYSQQEIAGAGALVETTPTQGRFLAGIRPYTVYSGTSIYGIFTSDEGSTAGHRGYLITPKIPAVNTRNYFRKIITKFKQFENASDRIRILYRTNESATLPAYETITLVNATSFTGTNGDVAVGDFVEIIAGDNAGAIAKITNIAAGSPNTYTIDLTLNASTRTARARYLNFNDLITLQTQNVNVALTRLSKRKSWIQFLIELRGTGTSPELDGISLEYDELDR